MIDSIQSLQASYCLNNAASPSKKAVSDFPSLSIMQPLRGEFHEADELTRRDDATMLDKLQRAAFEYFPRSTNPQNGLVADRTRDGSPSSIAVVGLALSSYPVGVERGWIDRDEAVQQTLRVLRFLWHSDQTGNPESTGFRGFYFHFLDMQTGVRVWQCELSIIDTALLIAGVLSSAAYFTRDTPLETQLRELAEALYSRVDWRWAQAGGGAVMHGWKPNHGFLSYGWEGYSEALVLYVLGLASPTHPLTRESFLAWTMTYQWENLYGQDFLYAGPLFIHQLSHAWIDFRGLQDRFMREKGCDYFENSRRATLVQREYAIRNPLGFRGYAKDYWGLSASDGPSIRPMVVAGRQQNFYGYAARGAPYGPDDGTIAGAAALSSLVFAPDVALPVVRALYAHTSAEVGQTVLAGGFNTTAAASGSQDWMSEGRFGIDQGLTVLMIENYRSGLLWELSRKSPWFRSGLSRAGFKGGWLNKRAAPKQ
jgi:hypothetical protein